MNEQLIKFIELCLTDGIIADKERGVILKKAKDLGVDQDECDVIIDAMIQQKSNLSTNNSNASDPAKGIIITKEYYDNGQIKLEGEFKFGKLNGKGKKYHKNGTLWQEGDFKYGRLHGMGKWYNENGTKLEGEFKNGELNGMGKTFSINGILSTEGQFMDGNLILGKRYYDNGNIRNEGEFTLGFMLNGNGKRYWPNGKLREEGEFKEDELNGKGKKYNKDGALIEEGEFKDGNLIIIVSKEQERKESNKIPEPSKQNIEPVKKESVNEKDYSVFKKRGVPWYMIEDLKARKINHIWYAKTILHFGDRSTTSDIFIPSEGKMTKGSAKIWINHNEYKVKPSVYSHKRLSKIEILEFFEIK
jgi:antitoxin component YwqK of YwqJK toxin-antitoxin module